MPAGSINTKKLLGPNSADLLVNNLSGLAGVTVEPPIDDGLISSADFKPKTNTVEEEFNYLKQELSDPHSVASALASIVPVLDTVIDTRDLLSEDTDETDKVFAAIGLMIPGVSGRASKTFIKGLLDKLTRFDIPLIKASGSAAEYVDLSLRASKPEKEKLEAAREILHILDNHKGTTLPNVSKQLAILNPKAKPYQAVSAIDPSNPDNFLSFLRREGVLKNDIIPKQNTGIGYDNAKGTFTPPAKTEKELKMGRGKDAGLVTSERRSFDSPIRKDLSGTLAHELGHAADSSLNPTKREVFGKSVENFKKAEAVLTDKYGKNIPYHNDSYIAELVAIAFEKGDSSLLPDDMLQSYPWFADIVDEVGAITSPQVLRGESSKVFANSVMEELAKSIEKHNRYKDISSLLGKGDRGEEAIKLAGDARQSFFPDDYLDRIVERAGFGKTYPEGVNLAKELYKLAGTEVDNPLLNVVGEKGFELGKILKALQSLK